MVGFLAILGVLVVVVAVLLFPLLADYFVRRSARVTFRVHGRPSYPAGNSRSPEPVEED